MRDMDASRTARALVLGSLAGLLLAAQPLLAQGTPDGAALERARTQAREALERQDRLSAIEADRDGVVRDLVERWRDATSDAGLELEAFLAAAPVERLAAALEAKTWSDFQSAVRGTEGPKVFGDQTGDLVFTPVAPCRVFDTRSAAAGILVANVVRDLRVNGDMTSQGGSATGCGIPTDPLAVVVNLAAVTPTGAGNIRAWRFGDAVPTAAAMNYNPTNTSPALSNMIVIPTCYICGSDISLRSDVSNVHAVGDIVGYFLDPQGLPRTFRNTFTFVNVPGTNAAVTLATRTFTPTFTGTAVMTATGYCNIDRTASTHGIGIGLSATPASGDVSRTAYMRVLSGDAVGAHQRGWAVQDYVTLTAGASVTVTLRAQQFFGSAGADEDCSGTMTLRETTDAF